MVGSYKEMLGFILRVVGRWATHAYKENGPDFHLSFFYRKNKIV